MDATVKNILFATFILSLFRESCERNNLNYTIPAKCDNRTDVVRLRRQSPAQSCRGDVLKFQCATTNDCLSAELECDGNQDCPDGSDEKESLCKDYPKKCRTPAKPDHGKWINLSDGQNDYLSSQINAQSVIKYSCNPGYKLSTTAEDILLVHCLPNGQWSARSLPFCQKLCQSLSNTPFISVSCKNEGTPVRCDRATDNTVVTYICAPHYESPNGRPKSSTCYDGLWDYIPECIPVCGEKRVSATPLIVNGHEVERGHYPWVVALYSRKDSDPFFTNICGGSLLSTDIVLTAAHCVSQKETGKIYDAIYFRVGAGKYYIHYDDSRDADTAQYADVAVIEAYREYRGEIQNFRGDIALLKLRTNLILSTVIQPVCYNNLPFIEPNSVGLVTGWGYTISSGEPSDTLRELALPYNPDEQCFKYLDRDFANRYFTSDKMCAGFNNQNTSVCNGDSGGGLVFRNPTFKGRYFIHGVVSLAHSYKENQKFHCNIQRSALFTRVENYVEWIQLKVRHWTRTTNYVKNCRAPAQPEYGQWAYLNNGRKGEENQEIDVNTAIIFSCNQGYYLSATNKDSLMIICLPTGEWNIPSMPLCQRPVCTPGLPGKCRAIRNCPVAIQETQIRGKHGLNRCGFQGQDEIVCCPDIPVTGVSGGIIAPASTNTPIKRKRKSEIMCEKFYADYNIKYFRNGVENANAAIGEFPHAAALEFDDGDGELKWNCGASLISTRFLLTAAHCFLCKGCTDPKVARLGTVDLMNSKSAQDIEVKKITLHPAYNPLSRDNDIGIVELVRDVVVSNLVRPACLYTKNDNPSELQMLGWQFWDQNTPARFLSYNTIQPITLEECNRKIMPSSQSNAKKVNGNLQFCVFNTACTGPSGNPVQLHNRKGGYDIVAIRSFGCCCSSKTPEVFFKVAPYLDWIEQIVWPDY